MKAKYIITTIISLLANFLVPFIIINYLLGADALGVLLILLITLNPIVALGIGISSGWSKKIEWYLPLINSIIFIISISIITGFDITYILAGLIYFVIGIIAALITKSVKKGNKTNFIK